MDLTLRQNHVLRHSILNWQRKNDQRWIASQESVERSLPCLAAVVKRIRAAEFSPQAIKIAIKDMRSRTCCFTCDRDRVHPSNAAALVGAFLLSFLRSCMGIVNIFSLLLLASGASEIWFSEASPGPNRDGPLQDGCPINQQLCALSNTSSLPDACAEFDDGCFQQACATVARMVKSQHETRELAAAWPILVGCLFTVSSYLCTSSIVYYKRLRVKAQSHPGGNASYCCSSCHGIWKRCFPATHSGGSTHVAKDADPSIKLRSFWKGERERANKELSAFGESKQELLTQEKEHLGLLRQYDALARESFDANVQTLARSRRSHLLRHLSCQNRAQQTVACADAQLTVLEHAQQGGQRLYDLVAGRSLQRDPTAGDDGLPCSSLPSSSMPQLLTSDEVMLLPPLSVCSDADYDLEAIVTKRKLLTAPKRSAMLELEETAYEA